MCLVFCSREAPDAVFASHNKTSPVTNRMEVAWVGLPEPDGAEATVRLGAEMLGHGDAELMHRWCGRHSFFLQLLGAFLVEARRRRASPDDALTELMSQSPMHSRLLWKTLTSAEQQSLRDAAKGLPASIELLKQRGLATSDGRPFGELFAVWLRGETGS
jgi:hypothetical protein